MQSNIAVGVAVQTEKLLFPEYLVLHDVQN